MGNFSIWHGVAFLLGVAFVVGYAYVGGWLFAVIHNGLSKTRILSLHRITWVMVLVSLLFFLVPSVLAAVLVPLMKVNSDGAAAVAMGVGLWLLFAMVANPLIVRRLVPTTVGQMKKRYAFLAFYGSAIVVGLVGTFIQLLTKAMV